MLVACTVGEATPSTGPGTGSEVASSEEGPSPLEVTDSTTQQQLPRTVELGELLESEFGVTAEEMRKAVDRARADVMRRCLVMEGWDVDEGLIGPEFFADPQPPAGGSAAGASVVAGRIQLVETGDVEGDDEVAEDPQLATPEYRMDVRRCLDEAVDAIADPVGAASQWLDAELGDVHARVGSDPRMVEADAQERRCLREAGGDPYATLNEIVDAAGAVFGEYVEGSRSREETSEVLRDLQRREEEVLAAIAPCLEARLAVEQEVAAEYEAEWLEENGERLAAFIADLGDEVAALADHLVTTPSSDGS